MTDLSESAKNLESFTGFTPRAGVLVAPQPYFPEGVGPGKDIVPFSLIPPGADLTFKVSTAWGNAVDGDKVVFQFTRTDPGPVPGGSWTTVGAQIEMGPVTGRPTTLDLVLPAAHLGEDPLPITPTPVWIRIVVRVGGTNADPGEPFRFYIDRKAPYQDKPDQLGPVPGVNPGFKNRPTALTYTNLPVGTTVDETWATANSGGLVFDIADFADSRGDDIISIYMAPTITNPPVTEALYFEGAVPTNRQGIIPVEDLRNYIGSRFTVWYKLTDIAGNVSNYSPGISRNIVFAPLPKLGPISVPLADDPVSDRLITLADARTGVTAVIARPANTLATDTLSFKWGGQAPIDTDFLTHTSLTIPVPYLVMSDEYFSTLIEPTWENPVKLTAVLIRNAVQIDTVTLDIFADFSVIGAPGIGDPPPLINPILKKLIVRGQAPITDNTLGQQDVEQTAKMHLTLWSALEGPAPSTDGEDVAVLYYDGEEVTTVALLPGDHGQTKEIDLPWDIVGPAGPGNKLTYWELKNPNRNNPQESPRETVISNTLVVTLNPPTIVRDPDDFEDSDYLIICDTLIKDSQRIARFKIEGHDRFAPGMVVTYHARGFYDAAKLIPSPTNTEFTGSYTIKDLNEATNGFTVDVGPYDPFIRNLVPPVEEDGGGQPIPGLYPAYYEVWYTIPLFGNDVPSAKGDFEVVLINSDFKYCEDYAGWMPTP